ncbi:hypothetical protein CYLTODRAFT_457657 [Cylindrobasidium torrendii FP15055 ss-10]|uniref:Fungal-type protein kinase domain-containing protein n=1 Tax=Cylindrobasidium torrendii FP15055 ss-10 TaxID=1314674 RepID=A0A0D7B0F2_9AGAR|nr:hypothetical protein CYLTODRAFT_457657 [Cylindrobasidium torrendii FP15055 ss-10]
MLLVPDLDIALVLAFAEAKSATNPTEPSAIFALNVRWIQASRGTHRGDMVCDLLRRACCFTIHRPHPFTGLLYAVLSLLYAASSPPERGSRSVASRHRIWLAAPVMSSYLAIPEREYELARYENPARSGRDRPRARLRTIEVLHPPASPHTSNE